MRGRGFIIVTLLSCLLWVTESHAGWQLMPGSSRAISRSLSASRDVAMPSFAQSPRQAVTAGLDFAAAAYSCRKSTLRLGFYGMMELQSDKYHYYPFWFEEEYSFPEFQNVALWRGLFGVSTAYSFDAWAKRLLGERGNAELVFSLCHESEHHTDYSNSSYDRVPDIGDFVMPEAAVRIPCGERIEIDLRCQCKLFIPYDGADAYTHGFSREYIIRWNAFKSINFFSSAFYEYLRGSITSYGAFNIRYPDNRMYRELFGVIFRGRSADLQLFASRHDGHEKGKLAFLEEKMWGWGIRIDIFGENN